MATTQSSDTLQKELKVKQICRFCLSQQYDKLSSIYQRDTRLKSSAPLPVQVMACASIEVFSNDGMPCMVCNDCRLFFEHAYRFKQMCKRAEVLLRQFPLTGQWPSPLPKPKFPKELLPTTTNFNHQQQQQRNHHYQQQHQDRSMDQIKVSPPLHHPVQTTSTKTSDLSLPRKKILNADPAESPEPPVPPRLKKEKLDKETTSFLNKMENNEELSIDDVHRLMDATDHEQVEHTQSDQQQQQHQQQSSSQPHQKMTPTKTKPKLLNKSSIRILNKDAEIVLEPRLSKPQLKRDVDGNMAVVTEILDPDAVYETEPDPVKDAAPVETVVFPCPHCERSFPLRQLRDIHMVNHTRSRSFQCQECEKSFFSKYDLQKHSLVHSGDRPYKCTVCDKGFTRATLLYRHERTHTDIPKFLCVYCEKPFISKEQMEKHSERHMKVRRYQCSVCKKSFAFKQGLERHEVVHSREQPYPCQYCDQSFSTPSKLARHLTAHAGKRPYPCKFCHKSYLLSHHLTRHLRSHKYGTVAFMCSDCDKVFKTRDELIYHSAVHATQTLVCPLCKERFEDIQSVTLHIKEHADGEAFACEFCDLIFMTAERLQYHTECDHVGDMAAYRENDEQMQRLQSDSFKQEISSKTNDDGNSTENLRILEETIEEFLVDELPDETNNKSVPIQNIKEEHEWVNQNSEQPQILDQIVLQTNVNIDENILVLDENIVEANEEFVSVEYNPPQQQPPTKMRKVATRQSQQLTKSVSPQKEKSGERRRKIAEISQPISTNKIKIELDDDTIEEEKLPKMSQTSNAINSTTNTSINSVLKMLPKSVSVRRNQPSNSEINSNEKLLTKRSPQFQEETRRSNRRKSNESTTSRIAKRLSSPSEKSPGNQDKSTEKKQIATASTSTVSTNNSSQKPHEKTKTMKIMMGEKKVKVQKITITKAEAVAMAKDGRIRIKDGNMVLSKMPKHE